MTADGAATISRTEIIGSNGSQANFAFIWDLGQLLFDRIQKH
jgi:hypothetical protein